MIENIDLTAEEAIKLKILKEQADSLKIKYHPNIGVDKLQAKIFECLTTPKTVKPEIAKTETEIRSDLRKAANKLHRVAVTCMNPDKRKWKGEIFTASNAVVGTVEKYIPFDGRPYHVPDIILKQIKNRKFQQFTEVPTGRGKFEVKSSLIPEFAISYLPPLTAEEFEKLKKEQAYIDSVPQGGLN